MPTPEVLSIINILTSVLLMPLVMSLWIIQGRLSKIEGRLEAMTARIQT